MLGSGVLLQMGNKHGKDLRVIAESNTYNLIHNAVSLQHIPKREGDFHRWILLLKLCLGSTGPGCLQQMTNGLDQRGARCPCALSVNTFSSHLLCIGFRNLNPCLAEVASAIEKQRAQPACRWVGHFHDCHLCRVQRSLIGDPFRK